MRQVFAMVAAASFGALVLFSEQADSRPPAGLFSHAPQPFNVRAIGDDARKASAVIGPEGGTVKTAGADGTIYELVVPEGALKEPVDIVVRPILRIEGVPAGSPAAPGLMIEPHGVTLDNPGELRITVPGRKSAKAITQAVVGYGDGKDLRLEIARNKGETVTLPVEHFTIYRIDSKDFTPDVIISGARDAFQEDNYDRFRNWLSDIVAVNQNDETKLVKDLVDLLKDFLAESKIATDEMKKRPEKRNASKLCRSIRNAAISYNYAVEQAGLIAGVGISPSDRKQAPVLPPILDVPLIDCRVEAEQACVSSFDVQAVRDQTRAEGIMLLLKSNPGDFQTQAWKEKVLNKCLRFEIRVDSNLSYTYTDGVNLKYSGSTKTSVTLKTSPENKFIATGIHQIDGFNFSMIDNVSHCKNSLTGKDAKSTVPMGVFLDTVGLYAAQTHPADVSRFHVFVEPGAVDSRLTYKDSCQTSDIPMNDDSIWLEAFKGAHGPKVPVKLKVWINQKSYPVVATGTETKNGTFDYGEDRKAQAKGTLTVKLIHQPLK